MQEKLQKFIPKDAVCWNLVHRFFLSAMSLPLALLRISISCPSFLFPSFTLKTKSWQTNQFLPYSNNYLFSAYFYNVKNQLTFPQKIPKEFPKEFPKNPQKFPQNFQNSQDFESIQLEAENPFGLVFFKVHIFWEGHKILRNLSLTFDYSTYSQK